jgi:hypothetical protein
VTWNQVQGLTRVGSQLWSTPPGSDKLRLSADNASPSEFAIAAENSAATRVRVAAKMVLLGAIALLASGRSRIRGDPVIGGIREKS